MERIIILSVLYTTHMLCFDSCHTIITLYFDEQIFLFLFFGKTPSRCCFTTLRRPQHFQKERKKGKNLIFFFTKKKQINIESQTYRYVECLLIRVKFSLKYTSSLTAKLFKYVKIWNLKQYKKSNKLQSLEGFFQFQQKDTLCSLLNSLI